MFVLFLRLQKSKLEPMSRWDITGEKSMKKLVLFIIAIAILPVASMGFNNIPTDKSQNSTKEIKSNTADDWTKVGTTVIYKKIRGTAMASQTVSVYKNSDGERAIKDGSYYRKFEENPNYHRYDGCAECDYYYRVFYEGEFWYTTGVVKQSW